MAALSSTQSGNFNSASTWGGTSPSDGDTFTINYGHKVTVNSDIRTTNGYGDIECKGNLHFASNGKIKLNGRITVRGHNSGTSYSTSAQFVEGDATTGSLLSSAGSNILIEFVGSNSDQHGIWVETERYASMKMEADAKRTTTSNSAAVSYNDVYIAVSSASGFASGDWISIYEEQEDERVCGDEGFWVQYVDTSNNRIYIRQFVSPNSEIVSVNSNVIKVANARVFREGYKVCCGTTSSDFKFATINSISYSENTITLDSNFSSSQVGLTLYQTGAEKTHKSGKVVEKIATTLTSEISTADSTNQITVGSAADIAVGDEIIIDVNNDSDFGWDYDSQYTVTAKSGNTLTLNDQVRHKHKSGSVVQILTRNMTIKGVDTNVRAFLYVEYWTDYTNASTRHIGLKNIRFTQFGGNTSSTYYRGVMIAGYNSRYRENGSDGRYEYQCTTQGCVMDNSNNRQSYTGLSLRHSHSHTMRNNVVYNTGQQGIWFWSSNHNDKVYNNYVSRTAYSSFQQDAAYEPYSEVAYNYFTRSDDYGYMLHNYREQFPIRHNYILNHEQRPMYLYYTNHEMIMERMHFDGSRYAPYIGTANGHTNFLDSYFNNRWHKSTVDDTPGIMDSTRYFSYAMGESRANYDRTNGTLCTFVSYEHNHFYDEKMIVTHGGAVLENSSTSGNMKVYNFTSSAMVYQKQVYVPANTTVRISAEMRPGSGSYSMPYLIARNASKYNNGMGRFITGYTGKTGTQSSSNKDFNGFLEQVQFTLKNEWEEKQITVQPQAKGYFLVVGIRSHDNAHEEVHDLKPINIYFDKPTPIKKQNNHGKSVSVRSSFNRAKKRIGGTRL